MRTSFGYQNEDNQSKINWILAADSFRHLVMDVALINFAK